MKAEASNLDKNANSDKGAVRRSFTPEEIKQLAKDFCYKWRWHGIFYGYSN